MTTTYTSQCPIPYRTKEAKNYFLQKSIENFKRAKQALTHCYNQEVSWNFCQIIVRALDTSWFQEQGAMQNASPSKDSMAGLHCYVSEWNPQSSFPHRRQCHSFLCWNVLGCTWRKIWKISLSNFTCFHINTVYNVHIIPKPTSCYSTFCLFVM